MDNRARFLSAKELIKSQILDQTLPRVGKKQYFVQSEKNDDEGCSTLLEERRKLLSERRVIQRSFLSEAEWNTEIKKAVVTKRRGKFLNHMGHHIGPKTCLYGEEALFLMEAATLEVTLSGVPLSIQEGYSVMLQDAKDVDRYHVFAHLMRMGYIVRRHRGSGPLDGPKSKQASGASSICDSSEESNVELEIHMCIEEDNPDASDDADSADGEDAQSTQSVHEEAPAVNSVSENTEAENSNASLPSENKIIRKVTVIDLTEESTGPLVQEEEIEEVEKEVIDLSSDDDGDCEELSKVSNQPSNSSPENSSDEVCKETDGVEFLRDVHPLSDSYEVPFPNMANKHRIKLFRPPSHLLPENVRLSQDVYILDLNCLSTYLPIQASRIPYHWKKHGKFHNGTHQGKRHLGSSSYRASYKDSDEQADWRSDKQSRWDNSWDRQTCLDQREFRGSVDNWQSNTDRSQAFHSSNRSNEAHLGNSTNPSRTWSEGVDYARNSRGDLYNSVLPYGQSNQLGSCSFTSPGYNQNSYSVIQSAVSSPYHSSYREFSTPLTTTRTPSYLASQHLLQGSTSGQFLSHTTSVSVLLMNPNASLNTSVLSSYNSQPHDSYSPGNYCSQNYGSSPSSTQNQAAPLSGPLLHSNFSNERRVVQSQNAFFGRTHNPLETLEQREQCHWSSQSDKDERWPQSFELKQRTEYRSSSRSRDKRTTGDEMCYPSTSKHQDCDEERERSDWFRGHVRKKQRKDSEKPGSRGLYQSLIPKIQIRVSGWKEYKQELRRDSLINSLSDSPLNVLWHDKVKPLLSFGEEMSSREILSQLSVMKQVSSQDANEENTRDFQHSRLEIDFDVYLPNTSFKKSSPPTPNFWLTITRSEDRIPRPAELRQFRKELEKDVSLLFAVITNGEISFYTLNDVIIPVQVPAL